jgi:4-amino-4-deoxy-L-arabinose transferase-like glycosyltransferase
VFLSPYMDSDYPLSVDASSYHQIAQNLVERRIFTSSLDPPYAPELPGTFRPPLTPFYLAAIYSVLGVNVLWGRIGLAVISALACGLTYMLGEKLFGRTTGIIAGVISCGYPFFLLLVHLPLTEGWSMFLTLALITLLYSYQPCMKDRPGSSHIITELAWRGGIGFIFGLSLLNKAANIVVFPCIVFWEMFLIPEPLKKRVVKLFIIVFITGIVILPWTIRNYRIIGTVIPVNSNGGWTFYLGNNPYTEKNLAALEQGISYGWIPPEEVFVPFTDLSFADTKEYEKRAIRLGIEFIRENPGKFANFAFRKLKIFWSPYPHIFDKMTWFPIVLLSIIGGWYSLSWWKKHLLVYVLICSSMSIPVLFTSMPRFRAPIMPFLIIYGAFGIVKMRQMYANRH